MKSLLIVVLALAFAACGGVTAVEDDATGIGGAAGVGMAGTTGTGGDGSTAGTGQQGGSGGAAIAGAGGTTAGAGGGATGGGGTPMAGTMGTAGATGAAGRGGTTGAGGAPVASCSWIQYFDANGVGTVTSVVSQTNTSACLSAASNYKSQHPNVPLCQGKISNASGSAFDSLNVEDAYPDANGDCHITVEATVPILVNTGSCTILVTVDLHTPHPTMQTRNPPPPCS